MSYLVIFLFVLNGKMAHMYLGEELSEAKCVAHAREVVPQIFPDVKEGMILCVKKQET